VYVFCDDWWIINVEGLLFSCLDEPVSTSTQNTSIWLLTAAVPSDSVFRAPCTESLAYLLNVLNNVLQQKRYTIITF